METLQINKLGASGLNTDQAPWTLPPEFITSGSNFRVEDGKLLPFSGSKKIFDRPELNVDAGYLIHVRKANNDFWLQCSGTHVLVSFDLDWHDISSGNYSISPGREIDWSGDMLGQYVIINHPEYGPQSYLNLSESGNALDDLPFSEHESWRDRGLTCRVMRSHKNFLIALGLSGTEDSPNGYRISHPADIDGLPFTWDTNDRSAIAVRAQLGSDGGKIIDGRSLRDSFCIYSEYSIDFLDFSPSAEYNWSRRELSSTSGLLSKDCVAEVNGLHYLITSNQDIVVNDGSSLKSIIDGRISSRFNSNVNANSRAVSYVVRNDRSKEIWFCVPEGDADFANVAYIFNWHDNSWSIRDLPAQVVFSAYGNNPIVEGEDERIGQWESSKSTWESINSTWGTESRIVIEEAIIGLNRDGSIVMLDSPGGIDEGEFNCFMERLDFPLDTVRQNNTVTRVYPLVSGGEFTLQFGSSDYAGGAVRWEKMMSFKPSEQRKLDFRTTGELLNFRIRSVRDSRFKFSGMLVEYAPAGLR